MSLWKADGQVPSHDVMNQRIAAGTVGDSAVQGAGINAPKFSKLISILDRNLTYAPSGAFSFTYPSNAVDYLGQVGTTSTVGASITVPFSGSAISIIAQTGPDLGRANITIDGVAAKGRVNTYTSLNTGSLSGLSASATTVPVLSTSSFTSTGTILIDDEQIDYTGVTSTSFTGCTRGANGTVAVAHNLDSMVYQYNSAVEFYSPYRQNRISVWSINNLDPGYHTLNITLRSDKHASSTATAMTVNGFIGGGVVGAGNINTYVDYVTITGVTTNVTGNTPEYTISPPGTDRQILGILGAINVTDNGTGYGAALPSWNPSTNKVFFSTNIINGTGKTIVISLIMLGTPL